MNKPSKALAKKHSVMHSDIEIGVTVDSLLKDHPNKKYLTSLIATHVPVSLLLKGVLNQVSKNHFHYNQIVLCDVTALHSWNMNRKFCFKEGFMVNPRFARAQIKEFDNTKEHPYRIVYSYKDDTGKLETRDVYVSPAYLLNGHSDDMLGDLENGFDIIDKVDLLF